MAASLTTRFDEALFDAEGYGFDVDQQVYVNVSPNTQNFERQQGQRIVRSTAP